MKLTIVPEDKVIVKDGSGLNFSNNLNDYISSSIPSDIHALQWKENSGEIEYVEHGRANESISVLPDWANECVTLHSTAITQLENELTESANTSNTDISG